MNAVQGAIELQKKMAAANEGVAEARRIVLRIGINLGDVIGEGSDIYGEGVNIAARLGGAGRARRHLHLRARCMRRCAARSSVLRGHGRAAAQEYRAAGARLSHAPAGTGAGQAARRHCPTSRRSPCCHSRI